MSWDNNDNNSPWGQGSKNKGKPNGSQKPADANIDEVLKDIQGKLKKAFSNGGGSGGSGNSGNGKLPAGGIIIILVAVALLWLASGFYTVNTKEEGVVLRFGEYVRTAKPGLNYHLPTPIERVIKVRVTDRYVTQVGNRPSNYNNRRGRSSSSLGEILMLTGDENIVDVNFEVQWQIADSRKYLFNVFDPEKTIRDAAESAMREIIGTTPLSDVLSEGRAVAQLETKTLLQSILDSYDIGVEIAEINMKGVPPTNSITVDNITVGEEGKIETRTITTTVDEAFKDVQAAKINKQEIINTAIARSNELIPEARGEAQKLLQEAEAYREKVVAKSQGEAKRFLAVYNEYRKAREVTKKRIYLETMEEVLEGMDKIVIDNDGGGVLPYLPLNEIKKK